MLIVGLLDLLAGILLAFSITGFFSTFFIYFAIIKGIWSIISSVITGYYYDWMGLTDLLIGIGLLLLNFGISHPFFMFVGAVMILKGIYTLIYGLIS